MYDSSTPISRRPISRVSSRDRSRVVPVIDFAQIYREVGETSSITRILEKKEERFRTKSEYRSNLPTPKGDVLYTHQSANLSDFHDRLTLA